MNRRRISKIYYLDMETKQKLKIRKATLADVPTLYKLVNEAYRSAGGWTGITI